jgi:Flp pilus assembly protein TadD
VTLRALEDNPELAADVPEAQLKRLKAEAAKERGNDAFKAKDYPAALEHYSEAITLDNTNSTYYSNRFAACLDSLPMQLNKQTTYLKTLYA